jgi:spermidine synthase
MRSWTLIDSGRIPGDGGELKLYRRGEEWSIMIDGQELMTSRACASEEALASLACARLADREEPRILIGGLGMGFTLAAALRELGEYAEVIVAEIVSEVVVWNRGPLGALTGHPVADDRVEVLELDVAEVIRERSEAYDAILLDVDNGPEGMTQVANDQLYNRRGLRFARAALRPGGILAVWSAGADRSFTKRLEEAGFRTEQHKVRARGAKGAMHLIWLATRID